MPATRKQILLPARMIYRLLPQLWNRWAREGISSRDRGDLQWRIYERIWNDEYAWCLLYGLHKLIRSIVEVGKTFLNTNPYLESVSCGLEVRWIWEELRWEATTSFSNQSLWSQMNAMVHRIGCGVFHAQPSKVICKFTSRLIRHPFLLTSPRPRLTFFENCLVPLLSQKAFCTCHNPFLI